MGSLIERVWRRLAAFDPAFDYSLNEMFLSYKRPVVVGTCNPDSKSRQSCRVRMASINLIVVLHSS